jgi:transcriptional regulator with XRE-family HTH domain
MRGLAKKLGARVGLQRRARGLSQRRLSALAGFDVSLISLIESGRRLPSLGSLYVIAGVLGCEAADLLPRKGAS